MVPMVKVAIPDKLLVKHSVIEYDGQKEGLPMGF